MNSKYLLVYRSDAAPSRACSKDRINQSTVLTQALCKDRTHTVPCESSLQRNHHHCGLDITERGTTSNSRQQPLKAKGIKEAGHSTGRSRRNDTPRSFNIRSHGSPLFILHNHPPAHAGSYLVGLRAVCTVRPWGVYTGLQELCRLFRGIGAKKEPQPSGLGSQKAQNP